MVTWEVGTALHLSRSPPPIRSFKLLEMAVGNSSVVNPEDELDQILDLAEAAEVDAKEGDTFFLMDLRWWDEWLEYQSQLKATNANDVSSSGNTNTGGSSIIKRPSAIDNSVLIYEADESITGIELRDTLVENTDYRIVPEGVWNQFHAWYGGGPALARKVICSGLAQTELAVEVYPLRLHLHLTPKSGNSTIRISRRETVGGLYMRASDIFGLSPQQILVWDYYGRSRCAILNEMDKALEDANIQTDQDILVEIIDNGGSSASKEIARSDDPRSSEMHNFTSPDVESSKNTAVSGVSAGELSGGLIGLANLGNTCYMNSAIQCLVHTPEFATYFMEDYHHEINQQNPLGMVGELALAFGDLLRKLWTPRRTSVVPRSFKKKLARFAPQFGGCDEHDSQELLAFLLDGLHEDLNRVKHKAYINLRDADGRPDEEIADEYWDNHKARNDSIVVDVCQGQYKSTLVCPVCNKISATFDPFMYLSLPIQSTTTRSMTVTVFTYDGSAPSSVYLVTVPKKGRCKDLIQAISDACFLKHDEKLMLAQIRSHLIDRFLEDPLMMLSSIKDDVCIAAYKIPKTLKNKKILQLIHRLEDRQAGNGGNATGWKPYGTPLVSPISCDEVIMTSDVQLIVRTMLSPMLRTANVGHNDSFGTNSLRSALDPSQSAHSSQPIVGSNLAESVDRNGSSSKSTSSLKLPLLLVDENNACIDLSVGEDKVLKFSASSKSILVFVNWSKDLLEEYDTGCFRNVPEVVKYGSATRKTRDEPLSLYSCLEAFLREEPLVPEDMWYCPQCKVQRQATKKLDLWRLPEVLIFHLKRFSFSSSVKQKLETFVDFPIHDLDLSSYVANKRNPTPQLYELYASINHYGDMGSGHYTAHIKLFEENQWLNFDDKRISPVREDEVKTAAAYVLFYRRVKPSDASVSNAAQSSPGHPVSFCK